jgi:heterodisulfide reductase subunit A
VRGHSKNDIPLYAIQERHCLYFIDGSCRLCEEVCPEKAIDLDAAGPGEISAAADAVVLATGFQAFDPVGRPRYGYGINRNVMTALELECMLRERAEVVRPSDQKVPEKIAFIQCVGSRDHKMGHGFCSQACCAYAIRMAEAISHRYPQIDVTIFYMDIQNCGKDFTTFYERSKNHIRFVRQMPGDIFQGEDDRLTICYASEETGEAVREAFDLAVLSIGIMPGVSNIELADLLDLAVDQHGFLASHDSFDTAASSREGVFLAGTVQGPKDIRDSIAQAGEAAQKVARYLGVIHGGSE